ncbi:hypothetical protein [Cetobacterium sp.]|uniref:hypothetical protein n=1 Tax=Cetobacterium sp. TaxID=2071632 RepID=UPI002FC5CDE0
MNFVREKKSVKLSEANNVVDYKSKVDYFKYTDNPVEAKELLNLEHQVIFCTGKIEELREKRWEALTKMRAILKKDGTFSEVMKTIGISKDMIYDINNREKIYLKCEVDRKEISKLPARVVKQLVQDKTLDKSSLERIIKSENQKVEYEILKEERTETIILTEEQIKSNKRDEIIKKINWYKQQIDELEIQLKELDK